VKCPQAEKLLEDYENYNDGELDPKRVSELESHLASCANCFRLLESLRREDRLYADYGHNLNGSVEITPSLWDGICRGVEAETRASGPLPRRLFAGFFSIFSKALPNTMMARQLGLASILVIISVCGTLLVIHYHQRSAITAEIGASGQVPGPHPRDLESALLSIKKAEQQYVEAIGTLSGIVDKKRDSLDPALAAELENNLKAIDAAIASSRKEYYAHPADPELAIHMLNAYQKKVGLLQDLALSIT
jgi:hypothetical protein